VKYALLLLVAGAVALGQRWEVEQVDSAGWGVGVQMKRHPDGRAFLCYQDHSGRVRIARQDSGWTHEDVPEPSRFAEGLPWLEFGPRGEVCVTYHGEQEMWLSAKADSAWTHVAIPYLPPQEYRIAPFTFDSAGQPVVAINFDPFGGVYVLNEGQFQPDVRNAIFWGNTASNGPSIYLDSANNSLISLVWSDIEGGWQGPGNFDSVPDFEDTVWFRLASPSHCIDAGTSDGAPEFDFEGDVRFDDPGSPNRGSGDTTYYDVGWDEYSGTGIEESEKSEVRREKTGATFVCGVLRLPSSPFTIHTSLFDLTGRQVLSLRPGPNDVSRLAPAVYFVRDGRLTNTNRIVVPR